MTLGEWVSERIVGLGILDRVSPSIGEFLRAKTPPVRRRVEVAWTVADRRRMEGAALGPAPREGAVVALCRWSTGATRDTALIMDPLAPGPGDLRYDRGGFVVTVTGRYWNRALDALADLGPGAGLAVLHTHPGSGIPEWSDDDNEADTELARFLFGEGFLTSDVPLVSLVASHTDLRGRALSLVAADRAVVMRPIERIRTLSPERLSITSTTDRVWKAGELEVPAHADRSVRVFGKEGQRLLADIHTAHVGVGGVGSLVAEQVARWGVGMLSLWDPDIVKDVNVNRSSVFTFRDAYIHRLKVEALARALPSFALVRRLAVRWSASDVRQRKELPALLDADVIVMLVDDARARHFVNRVAYAHYIPVLDGGNVIRSTAEDDADSDSAVVEGGAVRVSLLTPDGPCIWCAGHLDSERLGLAFRSEPDKAADRARGYVENLGPEHAPSVMPVNSMTAALLECRLQDILFGLSGRSIPEVHFDLLGGTLDELPRDRRKDCRQCARWQGRGDSAELPFVDA